MSDTSEEIIIIGLAVIALLMISALMSLSETALTGTSRARILPLERKGNRKAGILSRLILIREKVVASLLIANNLVNILASSLMTALFIGLFGEAGVAYATIIATILIVMFGEIMPKRYGLAHPEQSALFLAPFLSVLEWSFRPFAKIMNWLALNTLMIFGIDITSKKTVISAHQELKGTVDLFHLEGEVERQDKDMLGGLLDLQALSVEDVMVHRTRMDTICADLPIAEVVTHALESQFTRIPLWRENSDNIIGILHAKNLLIALHKAGGNVDKLVLDDLITPPWYVPNTTPLTEQLQAFLKKKFHFALVVDEYGVMLGHVTLEDVIEEIVGDIADEHDLDRSGIWEESDGTVLVEGGLPIRDLNRALDWDLPNDEATTIAGLVIHEARTIPRIGQVFTFYGYKFSIIKRQRNKITQLRVAKV